MRTRGLGLALAIAAAALSFGSTAVLPQALYERAFLLVANPGLLDANFSHTVVLAVREGPGGPLGVILNRPTNVPLRQILPDRAELAARDDLLFFGGPVQPDSLLFAFRSPAAPKKGLHVVEDIYLSGFSEVLDDLLAHPEHSREQRFFSGYSGWAEGQLEAEIAQGGWYVLPLDTRAIFDMNPLTLYQELFKRAVTPRIEARHGTSVVAAARP